MTKAAREVYESARSLPTDDLTEEIAAMRAKLFAATSSAPENFDIWCAMVRALCRLVAVQFAMRPTAVDRMNQAAEDVIEEMRMMLELSDTQD